MRCMVFFVLCFLPLLAFSQKKKKDLPPQLSQQVIYTYIDSLESAGAFRPDTAGLNGEAIIEYAEFPGGAEGWKKYLQRNFPHFILETARDRDIPDGTYIVWVEFTVDSEGMVTDLSPITNFGYGLEEGLMKFLRTSGKWKPAASKSGKINSRIKRSQVFVFETG